jgi:hypothetical protein
LYILGNSPSSQMPFTHVFSQSVVCPVLLNM